MSALRHALTIGFANRLARRMDRHNGYKTLGAHTVGISQKGFPSNWPLVVQGLHRQGNTTAPPVKHAGGCCPPQQSE